MLKSISKNIKEIKNDGRCSWKAQVIFEKLGNLEANRARVIILGIGRRRRES